MGNIKKKKQNKAGSGILIYPQYCPMGKPTRWVEMKIFVFLRYVTGGIWGGSLFCGPFCGNG